MEGIVEPTAASGDAPRTRIAGVDTTAPPMPNMPDRTPVPTPTTALSTIRQRSDIARRLPFASWPTTCRYAASTSR